MAFHTRFCLGIFATLLIFFTFDVNAQEACPKPDKVIFCYYSSWAIYRENFGNYNATRIDPHLCTHMVYAFAGLDLHGYTIPLDAFNDLPEAQGAHQYETFRNLRLENPCLKIMLSIGGWGEGSDKFSIMAEQFRSRENFVEHLLRFLVYYGFDGVDIDWEYPADRGGIPEDKANFVLLLKELRERLKSRNKQIAVAVAASGTTIENGYDVVGISEIVDYVLLMAYDYHSTEVTSHVAPLKAKSGETMQTVDSSVKIWLDKGCPKEKLVLGVLSSGRTFTLENSSNFGLGAKSSGPGKAGDYTRIDGFISYYEVCDRLFDPSWKVVDEDEYANIYASKDDQWMTYENPKTIEQKAKYAFDEGLAGVMLWSIDTDDFFPICSLRDRYPLHLAIRKGLKLDV